MTLLIETPETRSPERDYALGVVLGEFLGSDWTRQPSERRDVRISFPGSDAELLLPDVLFACPPEQWLQSTSMPGLPLAEWDTEALALNARLTDNRIPVIYGDDRPESLRNAQSIRLPVDIFGSAFFMLTRYEELVTQDRDEHDRFPAWASVAYKAGFLQRPIIDEYVELLWAAMKALWPGLKRKQRQFTIRPSHDVDAPARYGFCSPRQLVRRMGGDVFKHGNPKAALQAPWIRFNTRSVLHPNDPYNTFDHIMDQSERQGLQSAFYFICGRTHPTKDADYEIEHPAIRCLMRRIHDRGHEIGLHPSYNTYRDPQAIASEASRLRKVCEQEGIQREVWGGRMHYLRWRQEVTPQAWEAAGMAYDSTLGYADRPGFRCGTCIEYPLFHLADRKKMNLRIRPLIIMANTLSSNKKMGLGFGGEAKNLIEEIKGRAHYVYGDFNVLWHNSQFTADRDYSFYSTLLETEGKV